MKLESIENNPTATQSPLVRGKSILDLSILAKGNSHLTREYPHSGGGLLPSNSKFLQTKKGLLSRLISLDSNPMQNNRELRVIPVNLRLKARANKMSREMTISEQIIWFKILSKKQLGGYKFTKQKQVFNYIIDFYCSRLCIGIEIDGESHLTETQKEYDSVRSQFLKSLGINIIRISNKDVKYNLEIVKINLLYAIKQNNPTATQSPLVRGKSTLDLSILAKDNSHLTREYPQSGGGLLPSNSKFLQTKKGLLSNLNLK